MAINPTDTRCPNPKKCTCNTCDPDVRKKCEAKGNPEQCCHECDGQG